MLSRRITAALAFLICSTPVPAFANFCSGKYESTAEIVEAAFRKYGTLYSGGDHRHYLDDVGATLDLYRLWRGLPDLKLRSSNGQIENYEEGMEITERVDRWLTLAETSDALGENEESSEEVSTVAIYLDLATKLTTPRDDWPRISEAPLFDWLNTVMVASDAPWTISSHLNLPSDTRYAAYERLRMRSLQRFSESGGLEWAVAAQVLTPPGEHVHEIDSKFAEWQEKVARCQATQGEYAAWVSSSSARLLLPEPTTLATVEDPALLTALPPSVLAVAAKGIAAEATVERAHYSLDVLIRLAKAIPEPELAAWVGAGGVYQSSSVEELSQVLSTAKVSPYSIRAINLLSVSDLTDIWRSAALPSNLHARVLGAIFARNVALGRDEAAYTLLPDLKQVFTEQSKRIDEIDALWIPLSVKLALIALENPQISTWINFEDDGALIDDSLKLRISHRSRDLPAELASGVAVQEDFETWLYLPDRWDRYRGMHGYAAPLDRIYASSEGRYTPAKPQKNYTLIPTDNTRAIGNDFGRLAALDEISLLTPAQGLTHIISQNIVAWARDESDSWIKRLVGNRTQAAQALREVVLLNRTNDGGDLDGVPAGKAAFKLLKFGFGKTAAASQTPYWYESHCESEMSYEGRCWPSSTGQAANSYGE
jgi:hypothetical protein